MSMKRPTLLQKSVIAAFLVLLLSFPLITLAAIVVYLAKLYGVA